MPILEAYGPDIWLVDGDSLRFWGCPFTTRMTVIRLRGGALWVHSPVALNEARAEAVSALVPVAHLVAPNKLHHLFLGDWQARFPAAVSWAGPGVAARRPDLRFDRPLEEAPPAEWAADIDHTLFTGSRVLPEAVFFHRASRTLIFTDLIQNHDPAGEAPVWRWLKRAGGVLAPRGGVPRDLRLSMRDRDAARRALRAVLCWDFEHLVIAHGLCLRENARGFVESAFAWLGR